LEEVGLEEKAWAPAGSATARNVAIRRHIPLDSPVTKENALSVGQLWTGDKSEWQRKARGFSRIPDPRVPL